VFQSKVGVVILARERLQHLLSVVDDGRVWRRLELVERLDSRTTAIESSVGEAPKRVNETKRERNAVAGVANLIGTLESNIALIEL
jgi:hypothetical protein